jgi:hypothetical protein
MWRCIHSNRKYLTSTTLLYEFSKKGKELRVTSPLVALKAFGGHFARIVNIQFLLLTSLDVCFVFSGLTLLK